jgi:hypothetical protein
MDVKYQVFVSSTYQDLEAARREVIESLMNLRHIPVGMEHFQAANQSQWDYIKKRILQCDYYFVIVGERYGSVEPQSEKSYTQLEYEFAVENGIPVAAFLLSDDARRSWPRDKVEHEQLSRINAFRDLCQKKMVRYWSNAEKLGTLAITALTELIEEHPRPGWIRRDESALQRSNSSRQLVPTPIDKRQLEVARSFDNDEDLTPRAEWTLENYHRAFTIKLAGKDRAAAEHIYQHYLTSVATTPEERGIWEAETQFDRIIFKAGGNVGRLKELADTFPNPTVMNLYAHALALKGQSLLAAEKFLVLAENTPEKHSRVYRLKRAAEQAHKASEPQLAEQALDAIKAELDETEEVQLDVLSALKDLAEKRR